MMTTEMKEGTLNEKFFQLKKAEVESTVYLIQITKTVKRNQEF